METFKNTEGKPILLKMVQVIQENKDYLGQVDGEIGDGDHGANMNKGFTLFEKKVPGTGFWLYGRPGAFGKCSVK